jgi:citrate lyase beta subunit
VRPRREVVDIGHDVFTPSAAELAEWQAVLPTLEAARAEGTIVVMIDGKMYDAAGIERVQAQLDLARRLGLVG